MIPEENVQTVATVAHLSHDISKKSALTALDGFSRYSPIWALSETSKKYKWQILNCFAVNGSGLSVPN